MASSLDEALASLQGEDPALMGAVRRVIQRMQTPASRTASRLTDGFAAGGTPKIGLRRQIAPLGEVTFTATSGTSLSLTATPTKTLIGRKLVVQVVRTGASSTAADFVDFLTIGSNNQFVTNEACPASLFAPEVQGNEVDFDQAAAGVPIQVGLSLRGTALAGADTIRMAIGMLADTIG